MNGWLNEQIDGQMMGGYMNGWYCNVNSSVVLLTLSTSFKLSLSCQSEREITVQYIAIIMIKIQITYLYLSLCPIIYKSIPIFKI